MSRKAKPLFDAFGVEIGDSYRVNSDGNVQRGDDRGDWQDTRTRINSDSGAIENRTDFGSYEESGFSIDSGGVLRKEDDFGAAQDTGVRIDSDGTIRRLDDFGAYQDTGIRIDPDTGRLQKRSIWDTYEDIGND